MSARMVKAQTMRKRKEEEEEEDVFIINIFDDDDDTDADKKRSYDLMCRIYPVNRIARSPDVGASFLHARACVSVYAFVPFFSNRRGNLLFLRSRKHTTHRKKVDINKQHKHATTTTKKKASKCCGRKRVAIHRVFTRE